MKIFECTDSFLPIIDGVGRVAYNYADKLARLDDNQVYVVTPLADSGYRGSYPFELLDFQSVQMTKSQSYQTGIAQLDLHYVERVGKISPDIIHIHTPGLAGVEGLRLAEKFNVPAIGTFHSKYYDDFLRATGSKALATVGVRYVAEFYNRCDEVWTVSEDAAYTLQSYHYNGDIFIMPNGTELKEINEENEALARSTYGLTDPNEKILLYAGELDFKKNIKMTMEACAILKRNGHSFKFVLAGKGQDREALERIAEELGIKDDILFTGHILDPRLLEGLYMSADIFVFPSLYDTAGLVVREAAVMRTPSVVVENTAPAEVITDRFNGLICQNNADSLADKLYYFLFYINEQQRYSIAENARLTIPVGWDEIMRSVMERYSYVISKGHKNEKVFAPFEALLTTEKKKPEITNLMDKK